MSFPSSTAWSVLQRAPDAAAVPACGQEETRHRPGYQPEQLPVVATVRWDDIASPRPQTPTFDERVQKAAIDLPAQESTEAGRQFLLDFLQACRERGLPLDSASVAAARRNRTIGDLQGSTPNLSAERSSAFVETLLASIRHQGRTLPLGDPDFCDTLARYLPHMRRILETLAWQVVIPTCLDWQVTDYVNRLARVAKIVEQQQLAGAHDFCRLFIEPEPNVTVARQQRDWDHRLAELAPADNAHWQLRRRAAAALAPLLNPQVAQHLLGAFNVVGH